MVLVLFLLHPDFKQNQGHHKKIDTYKHSNRISLYIINPPIRSGAEDLFAYV